MNIVVIGGGPAGLYFSLLVKKAMPKTKIAVYERNRADDTFGFGVVFSDETLSEFMTADETTYHEIIDNFAYWDEIDVHFNGETIRSGGHGFCGIARQRLLDILHRRCERLGVELHFETEVTPDVLTAFPDADLIVAADGINSLIRDQYKKHFKPSLDWRRNKFVWLGTTKPLKTFTFIFRANEHGLWQVHAYQFDKTTATWIIETQEETWRRAGLENATEEETVAYCAKLFKEDLDGHPLLVNRSLWRTFPTVRNENWTHDRIVLMGDAVHTAHFSIGSGTKLAMEDAIAMANAVIAERDAKRAMAVYEESRKEEVGKLQHAAQVSLEWFENSPRYVGFEPIQFAMSLLSRSKRVTYENLRLRDPNFIAAVEKWFATKVAEETKLKVPAAPPMFMPFRLRDMTLANRVVCSPMCQYSAEDGFANDWHLVHLGSRAIGGAGLVFTEMTDVSEEGRITTACAGMYKDEHIAAWRRIVDFVHANSDARICLQLAHAGRKSATCLPWEGGYDEPLATGAWPIISASPIPYFPHSQVPKEMDRADMDKVIADFVAAARRAEAAGFDMIEIHMAHGYLLSSFISPLTNVRTDAYGGSLKARMRFPLEVFDAVRAAWPAAKPMSVRVSATDWVEDRGLTGEDSVEIAKMLKAHGCDVIDVSAGQTTTEAQPIYGRMFQVPFSDQIRQEAGIATIAVGSITSADQVNTIVASGRADLVALARPHLADPYFTLHAAAHYDQQSQRWPVQYQPGKEQAYLLAEREREEEREMRQAAQSMRPHQLRKAAE